MSQSPAQLANLNRNGRKPGSRNRPGAVAERIRKAASAGAAEAVRTLRAELKDPEASNADRIRATGMILDRAVGRPPAAFDLADRDRQPGAVADMLHAVGEDWAAETRALRAEREALANGGGDG